MVGFSKESIKAIRKWIRESGFSVGCRLTEKEFFYDSFQNAIFLPKNYADEETDPFFKAFLLENGLKNADLNVITLSILHELGHAETDHLFTEEEWALDTLLKINNDENALEKYANAKEYLYTYWNTLTEKSANNWAIMYANTFEMKTEKLNEIVEKALTFDLKCGIV